MAVPVQDLSLIPYVQNFNERVVASPSTWQLTAGQASALTAVMTPYVDAYQTVIASRESGTRSQNLTAVKDAAKDALLPVLRNLYHFIATNQSIPEGDKVLLGVKPRKERSPRPAPTDVPQAKVTKRFGTTVELTLDNADGEARLPKDAFGAYVYTFVGEDAPESIELWRQEGLTTRMKAEVVFDSALPAGTKVWFTAAYVGFRGQVGEGCAPISAVLAGGTMNVKGNSSLDSANASLKAA